jgi:hypothetical protein
VRTGVEHAVALKALFIGCFPRSGVRDKLGMLQELGALLLLSVVVRGTIVLQPGLEATCGEHPILEVHSFCMASERENNKLNNPWAHTSFQGFVLARREYGGRVIAHEQREIQRF